MVEALADDFLAGLLTGASRAGGCGSPNSGSAACGTDAEPFAVVCNCFLGTKITFGGEVDASAVVFGGASAVVALVENLGRFRIGDLAFVGVGAAGCPEPEEGPDAVGCHSTSAASKTLPARNPPERLYCWASCSSLDDESRSIGRTSASGLTKIVL